MTGRSLGSDCNKCVGDVLVTENGVSEVNPGNDLQTSRSLATDVFGGSLGDILQPGLSNRHSPFSVVMFTLFGGKREGTIIQASM